jgi:crotonobetainyl-CoA:carnitine CoA-transferase CaiB-like acyl-CoA transferase
MQQKAQYMMFPCMTHSRRWSDSPWDAVGKPIMRKHLLSGYMVNYNVYQCADNKWVALGL